MAKTIKKPADIFPEITGQLQTAFGKDLQSIVLYGSGASKAYVPGRSDLNFLVMVTEEGMKNMKRLHDLIGGWQKRRITTPLIMSKTFLENALDVYPVEFLTMQAQHVLVYGDDPLSALAFDRTCLRLQLEREIKGKLLHLRQGYLDSEGQAKKLRDLIRISLVAFLSLFAAILYLKEKPIPSARHALIRDACVLAGIDGDIFIRCLEIKEETAKDDLKAVALLFDQYLLEVGKMDNFINQLKAE
ncbi:MAG: hypothetical protein MUF26_05885 [Syntrophales bacterium]|nr:hypothetical protein [Syntrophales bacterium]